MDCPADCCYLVNSVNCTSGVNNCSDECCNDPHCCLNDNSSDNDDDDHSNGSNGNDSLKGELVHVSVGIIVVFFVVPMVGIIITVCYSKKLCTEKKEKKKGPDYGKL